MAIRDLGQSNNTLRDSLLTEEPFVYAHLVKFEKPLITETGKSGRRENDYIYISDGSFDVVFDDGSKDSEGNSNGSQVYIANKLISVGAVTETVEARATSMSLQVSAAALSTTITDSYTVTATTITGSEDLVEAGFREGDTVLLAGSGGNAGKIVRIDEFQSDNKRIVVTPQNTTLNSTTNETITITFKSPEVEGILSDRSGNSYARYINRDVFVYKAHINTETGAIIGTPYLLFKGIIASGKLTEDPAKSSVISWSLTSHWGDFSRVQGRLTSDQYHRALNQNNIPDPVAAIRPAYAGDLGFLHSEQAINLVAIYQVMETKYKLKSKSSFFGLKKSYKQVEYQVEVDREADLRFNLEAKYLPVVYGVNKIDSIPVFVDTLNSDSKKVFVAYALCEGQIGGIYDIYFDDTSSICIDENDSDTRSAQTDENTIDVLCQGRADRGDTLTSQNILSANSSTAYGTYTGIGRAAWTDGQRDAEGFYSQYSYFQPIGSNLTAGGASAQGAGITHEKGTKFTTPMDVRMQFHAGLPNQKASNILLDNSSNFKIATDYYSGNEPYWGANHRLLDTAYVVSEYTIGEGETTIPSLDFVVRGKGVECFNYDFSYAQDPAYVGSDSSSSAFNIGEEVSIKYTDNPSVTISTATIADIFTITNVNGETETRIRFTEDPSIGVFTNFFLDNGSDQFHLVTYDHTAQSGTVPSELTEEITAVSNNAGGGVNISTDATNTDFQAALSDAEIIAIMEEVGAEFDPNILNEYRASLSAGVLQNVGTTQENSTVLVSQIIAVTDAVKLASSASSSNDAYNGYEIEVTRIHTNGDKTVQTRTITDYNGAQKIVKVSEPWELIPKANDTYKIYSTNNDIRVTTNPALQLLDYMRSARYGRDLDLETDLNKESFFETARACDTRSNVFMLLETSPTVGDVYKYATSGGKTLWQGKVESKSSISLEGTTYYVVEFEEVLGKIVNRWENWKYFFTGELYYKDGVLHEATSDGTISYSASANLKASLSLSKVSGTGSSTVVVNTSTSLATFDGDPVIKKVAANGSTNSGYVLYDSDDVKYWRYLGWEAQNQRHVTRHQTNAVIDTARPIFDNINSMLSHFNGILRYSAGKYSLGIKTAAGLPTTVSINGEDYVVERINEEDIIGSINVEDAGQKGTYNQVDVSINDPQNRFEGRSVMMFNSNYLKEDRMVPKKGSVRTPYITNYYNARINAKQYLDDSRAGLKINFTMAPRGILLRAGDIIELTYPRFGWTNKQYRITNLNINQNCLIQVTAEEHSDEAYIIQAQNHSTAIGPVEGIGANQSALSPPTGLSATTDKFGGIQLTWTNSTNFKAASYSTQIWASDDNNRANATLLDTTKASSYIDSIVEGGSTSKYYWVRHVALVPPQTGTQTGLKEIFSAYEPSSETAGIQGTAGDIRAQRVDLTVTQGVISYDIDGANPDISSITITAQSQGFTDPYFKFTGGGAAFTDETAWTDGSFGTSDNATFTVPNTYSATPYTFTVEVKEGGTGDVLATDVTSIASIKPGSDGVDALTVYLDNPVHSVNASSDGTVSDFGSAGTTISVYEGTTQLDYDGSGTTAGHWTVTAAGTNITPATISESGDNAVLADNPSNMTADNAKIVLSISGKRLDGTAFSVEAQQSISKARNGTNGSDGDSARTVALRASNYTVSYDAAGGNPDVSSITLTADSYNFTDAYFQFTGGGSAFTDETSFTDGSGANQDTATFSVPTTYSATPYTFTVQVKESGTGEIIATDTLTIASLKPGVDGDNGVDALTLILTNPAHTIPVGTDGSLSYTGSGTTIQLFEGVTALDYDGAGTTNGHWTVSVAGSNITPGAISDSGNNAVAAVASAMTDDVASITYTITGKRADGNAISLTAIQSFAKANRGASGTDSKVVTLRASEQVVAYNAAGGSPSVSTITLTAESQNFTNGYFKFTGGGTAFTDESTWTDGSGANSDTASFTVPTSYSATPYTFTVSVKEGSASGDIIATDTITVASVKPGVNGTDAQNQKVVFLFKKNDSSLGFTSGNNASSQTFANPTNGVEADWSTTQPAITADGDNVYMSQRLFTSDGASPQEASWSTPVVVASRTDGGAGGDGQSVKFVQLFKLNDSTFSTTTAGSYSDPTNSAETGWTTSIPALANNNDKVYMVARTFTSDGQSPQDSSWSTPVIVAQRTDGTDGDPGTDSLTAILSNEAHAISQNISGTVSFTGSGTSIRLFEGATELDYDGAGTSNGKWTVSVSDTSVTSAVSPFTENGNQVDVSAITAMSGSTGSRTFTITGKRADGTAISLSKIQSFVRTVDGPKGDPGDDGVDGVGLSAGATHVTFNKDGSTYDPTTTSTVSLSAVGGTITAVTYTASASTYMTISGAGTSGCTVTFSANRSSAEVNAGNYVTAAVTGTTSDGATGVSFGSIIINIPTSINGVNGDTGADGLRSVQGYVYYEKTTANAPSAPASGTYTFSTGAVSGTGIGTGVNTWTNEPRTQDPTSSNTHYVARYYGIESAANSTTITVSFSGVSQYTNFSEVVTFTNGTFQEGGTNITTIDGGNISTNTIKAAQLEISSSSATNSSMFFDGTNNRIDITDSGGNLRVRIGKLS